jgi:hypothetical protein
MVTSAPAIDTRLLAALVKLDDEKVAIAETHRRLGRIADELRLTRPSYQQVRTLVHLHREGKVDTGIGELLLEFAYRARPITELGDALRDRA